MSFGETKKACNLLGVVFQVLDIALKYIVWYHIIVAIRPIKTYPLVCNNSMSFKEINSQLGNFQNTIRLEEMLRAALIKRANRYSDFKYESQAFTYKGNIYYLDKIKTNYSSLFLYYGLIEFKNGKPFINKVLDDLNYKDIVLDTDPNAQLVIGCWKGKSTLYVINHHEFKFLWTFFERNQHAKKQAYFKEKSMKFRRIQVLADYLLAITTVDSETSKLIRQHELVSGSTDIKQREMVGLM